MLALRIFTLSMYFTSVVVLYSVLNAALCVEVTVHVSTGVASSVCQQQQDFQKTESIQPPVTSRPQNESESESETECGWFTIPQMAEGAVPEIFRRSCDELESENISGAGSDGGSSRIVNGELTQPHEFPTLVAMFRLEKPPGDEFRNFHCGGTILSENWVMTAAHCFDKQPNVQFYRIEAGSFNTSDRTEPVQVRDVDKIIAHPKYDSSNVFAGYDIGLMHVTKPFVFDDTVQKLVLPPASFQPSAGGQITAVGRGQIKGYTPTPVPYKANFTTVSEAACKKALAESYSKNVSDTILCARVTADGERDICFGDSGSPVLFYGQDKIPSQVGIISFYTSANSGERSSFEPRAGCGSSIGGIFGSISTAKLLDWINENTAG